MACSIWLVIASICDNGAGMVSALGWSYILVCGGKEWRCHCGRTALIFLMLFPYFVLFAMFV